MTKRWTLGSWVGATWGGWLLAVPVIALLALVGEAIGIGGSQSLVGAGVGCAVGITQGRAVRRLDLRFAPWFWSCVVGLTTPFLASDLSRYIGVTVPYSLPLCVAIGGLISGVLQARALRSRFAHPSSWIPVSTAGWLLAAGCVAASDWEFRTHAVTGLPGALLYLAMVTAGGPLLGIITGAWFSKRQISSHT